MDLGYRCSLLYKAFWGEEEKEQIRVKIERKNELRRYMGPKWARVQRGAIVRLIAVINGKMGIFEWNGERFNCPVRLLHRINKQTKEEFEAELFKAHGKAIEKFTETRLRVEFKRADELFEHAKIRYYAGRTMKTSIFVRCPKCGRIGKLRKYGKTLLDNRYVVCHTRYSIRYGRFSESACKFGTLSKEHEYLDEIYRKYKEENELESDYYRFKSIVDKEFKKWLREKGLSERSVRNIVVAVKIILKRYGLVDLAVLKERLNCTQLKRRTVEYYISCFRHFLEFLRSSLTEEEKKGKEVKECELSK